MHAEAVRAPAQLGLAGDLEVQITKSIHRLRMVEPQAIHDRSTTTNTGWKILLGRGLDIFQRMVDSPVDLATKYQKYREVRGFGITFLRESAE